MSLKNNKPLRFATAAIIGGTFVPGSGLLGPVELKAPELPKYTDRVSLTSLPGKPYALSEMHRDGSFTTKLETVVTHTLRQRP